MKPSKSLSHGAHELHPPVQPDAEFWKQVMDHEVLDPEFLEEYQRTMESQPQQPLGALLIKAKYLGVRQVMRLLEIQIDEPNLRLGELAVREGYCTPEQIDECLCVQRDSVPSPIDSIANDSRLNEKKMREALVGYVHYLERLLFVLRY